GGPGRGVRRTGTGFPRYGPRALVIAPFIPGLTPLAPPLAGESGMPLRRFLALDGLGDLLWASTFVGVGWLAGEPFFRAVELMMGYGGSALEFFAGAVFLYLLFKFIQLHRVHADLRVAPLS